MPNATSRFAYFLGGVGPNVKSVAVISFVALVLSSCSSDLAGHRVAEVAPAPGHPEQAGPPDPADRPPDGPPVLPPEAQLLGHMGGQDKTVALTFDDGPNPEHTPQVLELLEQYDAVATFCVLGAEAEQHPELVRAVVDAGMQLCNHTVSHDYDMVNWSESKIEEELLEARDIMSAAVGSEVPVPYFRAPGGFWSDTVQTVAARNGMKPLSWSVDTRDWTQPGAAEIVAAVKENTEPGAVVLLHDGGGSRGQTVAALAELLPWFVDQGYRFVVPPAEDVRRDDSVT